MKRKFLAMLVASAIMVSMVSTVIAYGSFDEIRVIISRCGLLITVELPAGMTDERLAQYIEDETIPKDTNQLFGRRGGYISDLSPLVGLADLHTLHLFDNQVSDLSPLKEMKRLHLNLDGNPVTDEQIAELYAVWVEQIECERNNRVNNNKGHVLGRENIAVRDALEILRFSIGLPNVIGERIVVGHERIVSECECGYCDIWDCPEPFYFYVPIIEAVIHCEYALYAALIIPESIERGIPMVTDALHILRHLVGLQSALD